MITVKSDRTAYIPQGDRHIGYENDHLVEERLFEICDASLVDFSYKLDIKNTLDIVDLAPVRKTEDTVILSWKITSSVIGDGGIIKAQLRAFDESGERVWHSEIMDFFANPSINAEKEANEERIISEFEALEIRVQTAVNGIESSAQEAKSNSEIAKENAQTAIAQSERASISANAALVSEENSKTSETNAHMYYLLAKDDAEIAKSSCEKAQQSANTASDSAVLAQAKALIAAEQAEIATEKATSITTSASFAEQNAISARENAQSAKADAQNASLSAGNAVLSAQVASRSAENAQTSAYQASTSEQNADISAKRAEISEQNAKSSEDAAKEYASIASGITEYIKAENIIYDNSTTGMESTDVNGAIGELCANFGGLSFSVSESGILTITNEGCVNNKELADSNNNPLPSVTLLDQATQQKYNLYINDGKLAMEVIE